MYFFSFFFCLFLQIIVFFCYTFFFLLIFFILIFYRSSLGGCFGLKKNLMLPITSNDQKNIYYMVDGIVGQQGVI